MIYDKQKEIARLVTTNSEGNAYVLRRFGPVSHFEGDYARNYQYLMWLYGNEPVVVGDVVVDRSKKPVYVYSIYEYKEKIPEAAEVIFESNNVAVTKRVL